MGSKVLYFAYGSNMLRERLQKRCKSAEFVGIASTKNYDLRYNKQSDDGSGKANLMKSQNKNAIIYGALFEIEKDDLEYLDKVEGYYRGSDKHYDREENFEVILLNGDLKKVITYIARPKSVNEDLFPYIWYRAYVVAGAIQNKLPKKYIEKLKDCKIMACDHSTERCVNGLNEARELLANTPYNYLLEDL